VSVARLDAVDGSLRGPVGRSRAGTSPTVRG
jgi:hypothetical protein